MDTNKIKAPGKEERVIAFEKKTTLMAVVCWELAKKCCWPQKTFEEKMNRSMISHISFLLGLEADPYAAFQNCCNNILQKCMQLKLEPHSSATERKQQHRIFWRRVFDTSFEIKFSKALYKSALPGALLEMLEDPGTTAFLYWTKWFSARNKKKQGELFNTILAEWNKRNDIFL